jgi:hypothetical protein
MGQHGLTAIRAWRGVQQVPGFDPVAVFFAKEVRRSTSTVTARPLIRKSMGTLLLEANGGPAGTFPGREDMPNVGGLPARTSGTP